MADTPGAAQRRLDQLNMLPPIIETERDLLDENDTPPIASVLTFDIERAKRQSELILFSQISTMGHGQKCLHLNDTCGSRYWLPLGKEEISPESLLKSLYVVGKHFSNPVALFPHKGITAVARKIPKKNPFRLLSYRRSLSPPPCLPQKTKKKKSRHLDNLEAETIHIFREGFSEADNPVMLYSVGKDSSVLLHLARKAFYPATPPFPLLHVDTRWKFQEMYQFRDCISCESGMRLLVHINPEAIEKNINPFDHDSELHTRITKTEGLKQALKKHGFDMIFCGARRDEEKSRAKERIFSLRSENQTWNPRSQRPEFCSIYNTRKNKGESIRVFPLSNWTEMDIWQYIYQEGIPVVSLYFSKMRPVVRRNGQYLLVDDDRFRMLPGEEIEEKKIRFRTLGCYPLTSAIESEADSIEKIIEELSNTKISERRGRSIDSDTTSSMEKKKQEGYF